jgi:hypothetical protein
MVLRTKRPTLAKTAPGWGTLKFRFVTPATQSWTTAGPLLQTSETPVDSKGLKKVSLESHSGYIFNFGIRVKNFTKVYP